MDERNVASLEASKRLHDAGIILETDAVWEGKEGQTRLNLKANCPDGFPAPSMAEVWRELPEGIMVNGSWAPLFVNKISCGTSVGYRIEHHIIIHFSNENPTDALIDLLIFVRKEQGNENIGII